MPSGPYVPDHLGVLLVLPRLTWREYSNVYFLCWCFVFQQRSNQLYGQDDIASGGATTSSRPQGQTLVNINTRQAAVSIGKIVCGVGVLLVVGMGTCLIISQSND